MTAYCLKFSRQCNLESSSFSLDCEAETIVIRYGHHLLTVSMEIAIPQIFLRFIFFRIHIVWLCLPLSSYAWSCFGYTVMQSNFTKMAPCLLLAHIFMTYRCSSLSVKCLFAKFDIPCLPNVLPPFQNRCLRFFKFWINLYPK